MPYLTETFEFSFYHIHYFLAFDMNKQIYKMVVNLVDLLDLVLTLDN